MKRYLTVIIPLLIACLILFAGSPDYAVAKNTGIEMHVEKADLEKSFAKRPYSPWAKRGYPNQIYWGDTHLHTTIRSWTLGAATAWWGFLRRG